MKFLRTKKIVETTVMRITLLIFMVLLEVRCQTVQLQQEFTPTVSATCQAGIMTIKVATELPFYGVVHARDYRKEGCSHEGKGETLSLFKVNLLSPPDSPDYCGIIFNNRTEDRSIPISVRLHRTLELADDKFYVITCGKSGFRNSRNETSVVSLRLVEDGRKTTEVVYGHEYILRVDLSKPDTQYGIRVKSCFSFGGENSMVQLINNRGCSDKSVISQFRRNEVTGTADAILYKMFKFPDSNKVHFQCDVVLCNGPCNDPLCEGDYQPQARAIQADESDNVLMASTTVFVLEPGAVPSAIHADCGLVHPQWLLYLTIALGILFLIMLVVNIFLCSAMTCSCTRTEVIEKEPSIIEEYDPYRSWHGSQYGSRYSLNGKPGYTSGGSTMNSTRSFSTNSDHYAMVHSRPHSRYSAPGSNKEQLMHMHRGPGSTAGSHYSARM